MPMSQLLHPPVAPVREHTVSSPHGERLDPYYWLRDDERTNPEVLAYLSAENAYHAQHLAPVKPLEDQIYGEIVARLKQDDSTVPYRKKPCRWSARGSFAAFAGATEIRTAGLL